MAIPVPFIVTRCTLYSYRSQYLCEQGRRLRWRFGGWSVRRMCGTSGVWRNQWWNLYTIQREGLTKLDCNSRRRTNLLGNPSIIWSLTTLDCNASVVCQRRIYKDGVVISKCGTSGVWRRHCSNLYIIQRGGLIVLNCNTKDIHIIDLKLIHNPNATLMHNLYTIKEMVL